MSSIRRNVFKKSSPNGKVTVYLGRRDYFDDLKTVDPIDGVIMVDGEYLPNRRVFARIECAFRYGREDMDNVISGVTFKKEFYFNHMQVYPPGGDSKKMKLTVLQDRLMQKFGEQCFPFRFDLPHDIPSSIILQPHLDESPDNQPCGIEYNLQVYVGEHEESDPHRYNSVRVMIRRLTTATPGPELAPYTREIRKEFHLHTGSIKVEATLPKEVFYHGETIPVNIVIDNTSSNIVRRAKIQVVQATDITLFRPKTLKTVVAEVECEQDFPIEPGHAGWCRTIKLRPTIFDNRTKTGLALDGKLKHEDTNLATSTLIKDYRQKSAMGMVVQYLIRVKIFTGFGGRDTELEVPFILTHLKPEPEKYVTDEEIVVEKFSRMKFQLSPEAEKRGDTV